MSFHEEMTLRKKVPESNIVMTKNTLQLQENQDPVDSELSRRIYTELEMKEKMIQNYNEKGINSEHQDVLLSKRLLQFNPPIILQINESEEPLKIKSIKIGESIIDSDLGGNCFHGMTEDSLGVFLTRIRFESPFYHTTHGKKKLSTACKKIRDLSKLKFSSLYSRTLWATIEDVGERISDLWIISEPRSETSFERLLNCSGAMSLKKSMVYFEAILQSLVDLHACNSAHQDLSISNVIISTSLARVKLANAGVSRIIRDLHQGHPISNRFQLPDEIHWRPPELISSGGQSGKKADIWCCAYIFLQMLFGPDFPSFYDNLEDGIDAVFDRLPHEIRAILTSMFHKYIFAF